MPNWCSNNMVVYGSPTEVKDFRNKVLSAIQKAKTTKHWELYEIYTEFGYGEEVLENSYFGYNRGNIIDVSEIQEDKNECYFSVYYESAWSTMCEGFDYLLHNHYKTLAQVTLAEEEGNDVFINTDVTGKFFTEKYYVYVEDYDTYYCSTEEEVLKIINDWNDLKPKCKSIKDCYRLLQEDNEVGTTKQFISLHEYDNVAY